MPAPALTPRRLLPILAALTAAALAAGCASRVVVQDEPPRRPLTTSSLPAPTPPQPVPAVRPLDRPYAWNQSPSRLKVGGPPPPAAASAPATARPATHVAAAGDTLYGLSRRYHVSMDALMATNRMRSPVIKPGDTLVLPR